MNKQYRTIYQDTGIRIIELYNNGKLISTEEYKDIVPMYCSEEYFNRVAMLQEQGYTEGYTQEEVNSAKCLYEHKLTHLIKEKSTYIKHYPRCDRCDKWLYCPKNKDNDNNCPDYKRDPPDGGSY